MFYCWRREDGSSDPHSSATFIDERGRATPLRLQDFSLSETDAWKSPATGAVYPLGWRIEVPQLQTVLEVAPALNAQEMITTSSTGIIYWEGSILVSGRARGRAVKGRGYMELTGYAADALGQLEVGP